MNLEDKILGEKLNYYCSSSEDEKEDSGDERDEESQGKASAPEPKPQFIPDTAHFSDKGSSNTGPKGNSFMTFNLTMSHTQTFFIVRCNKGLAAL